MALLAGSASAFFLWALDLVTRLQWAHPKLLWGLPLGGLAVGLLYHFWGKSSDKGNNLILEEIHEPGGGVPSRMAPLVLWGTLVTHLFGGSAGREGTAVQMGGSLAAGLARWLRVGPEARRIMLMCGVAAGFGSVFGTPLAGAVFAMEVLVIGRIQYEAIIPVLIASVVGDVTCSAWGVHHTLYHLDVAHGAGSRAALDLWLLLKVALAGIAFGLVARAFAALTHAFQKGFARIIPFAPFRPVLGGLLVIAMVGVCGSRDYLGLGVNPPPGGVISIVGSFDPGGAATWSWLWKLVFTSVTLSSGFKGGEVTPLFFIGATLGNTLALVLHEPVGLFAALGFIAVFAGAANTPLACTFMGIELFGSHHALYFAVACFAAYLVSGHSGIYRSQRLGVAKHPKPPETKENHRNKETQL
ncbi:MAG TPA: voltage-gated chloride channel family protein [Verrucomicrobium sp.]|nr:voltage-gated chloride channel family protein [Verrucomicrobium sp.]